MKKFFVLFFCFLLVRLAMAQYWFGPTFGLHLADHDYLSSTYDKDSFNIKPNFNFHAGLAFAYTATTRYSVYGEVLYERIGKKVTNVESVKPFTDSRSQYHFLSIPVMLRVNFGFGNAPFRAYVGGGTKISYWLGGNGKINLDQFDEFLSDEERPVEYTIVYRQSKSSENKFAFVDANRLQYALQLGAGLNFELINRSQIFLDFRFTFGHSNMGFNGSPDFSWDPEYYENFEYRHHLYALSVGYMIEYNAQLARKGKSTIQKKGR